MADLPDLFDVRRRSKKKTPPAPDGSVQRLLGIYIEEYEKRFGEKPQITKADGALLKALIVKYGVTVVEPRIRLYVAWTDDFVTSKGHTLRMMHAKWNELAAKQRTFAKSAGVPDADATDRYLERLRAGKKR